MLQEVLRAPDLEMEKETGGCQALGGAGNGELLFQNTGFVLQNEESSGSR